LIDQRYPLQLRLPDDSVHRLIFESFDMKKKWIDEMVEAIRNWKENQQFQEKPSSASADISEFIARGQDLSDDVEDFAHLRFHSAVKSTSALQSKAKQSQRY
jgi:hypothetical protein